mgnify:CR=1 FL=1
MKTADNIGPLVTAIVSTYNSAEFIRGCIEDLELQTIAEQLEIIVIDSASLQDEGWIVRELQQLHGNIRYLRTEQRETVYAAWNRAIGMAHGRYITNANTDDRHRRDAFELMVRVLENDPAVDLVYADVIITQTPHETYEQHTATGRYSWFDWDRNTLLDNGCFIGPQPMWRRSVHELYGSFDDSYVTSGDYEFWLRISQTADFRHINQPLGLYLAHPGSIEHRNEDKKQRENRRLLDRYLQAVKERRLVGFQPFQRTGNLQVTAAAEQVRTDIVPVIRLIDGLLQKGRSLPVELSRQYAACRSAIMDGGDISAQALADYQQAVEQALLASREWFVRRAAVYADMDRDESALRHKVRAEAIRQAELLSQRGDLDAAVDILISKGIRSAANDPAVYGVLADLLLSYNRFQDVLALLSEMPPATDPALILELQGVCHAALGDEAAADAAARQAIPLGGNRSRSLVVLGTLAVRNSMQLYAESYFSQALEQDPACASAWLASGVLLWGKGDRNRAWKAIRRAVEVNPLAEQAMAVFLEIAVRTERLPDALQIVLEAVILYPDSRNLAVVRAKLLSQCGYDDKALQACESFLVRFGVNDVVLALALDLRHKIGVYDQLKQAGSESVSLCMIVKNEENCLARCLASARPVAHELIVVDTGSTDRTVDIARVFGAKVGYFPWTGNFAEARNRSLQQAQGSWILVLDADEVIAPRDYDVIRGLVLDAAATKTAWRVLTRNYTIRHPNGWCANDGSYPVEERGGGWFPSSKVRLFRNSRSVRFSGVVHEMVEDAAEKDGYQIGDAPFIVHHYGRLHDDGEADFEKKTKYYELGMQKLEGTPDDLTALRELAIQAAELKRYEEAIELWDRFLALQPDAVIALFNKGYALMMQEHYREALEVSRRVLDLEPAHKEAAFNYGSCELYVGDPQRATARLEDVLKSYPEHPPLLALLFVLDLATSRSEQAKNRFRLLKEKNYLVSDYLAARLAVLDLLGRTELAKSIRSTANSMGL